MILLPLKGLGVRRKLSWPMRQTDDGNVSGMGDSIDGHLGSFDTLAIVDSTAINIGVHVPLQISIFVSFG